MTFPYVTGSYTLISMAEVFQEFFYGPAGTVTFKYMDEHGVIFEETVENIAALSGGNTTDPLHGREIYFGNDVPPVDVNPPMTGSMYVDQVHGLFYICIDITTNANIWVSSGECSNLQDFITPTPSVTFPSAVNEGSVTALTIDNFDPNSYYNVVTDLGGISAIDANGSFDFAAPSVTTNTPANFTINRSRPGYLHSDNYAFSITVVDAGVLPPQVDQTLVNPDFASNAAVYNGFVFTS